MKQKIYTLGLITIALIITGSLLKINHWPGAAILFVIGVLTLVFVFLPLALKNHYNTEGNRRNALLYIVIWLTCFVVFGGMLFKIMHWPGAGIALMIALPFPYVVFLPVFLTVTAKDKNFNINNTVAVLVLLAGVSVFSALLALNVSKGKIDDSMQLSGNYNRLEAALEEIPTPAVQSPVGQKIDDLLKIVNDYQELIFASGGITEQQWKDDPWSFPRPDASDVAATALVIKGKKPTLDIRLQTGISELIGELDKSASYKELAKAAPAILNFEETPEDPNGWTQGKFGTSPRVWSVIYLDGLEVNLKLLRAGLH
ncbi:MAG: hypothetical protein WCD55_02840 [Bacteroidales bacterium]